MIPLTSLLLLTPGLKVGVLGDGRLRFAAGDQALFAASAVLSPNAAGLLADAAGRPVLPQIKVGSGALRIAADGTVTAGGKNAGRIYLYRTSGIGHPGEGTFGILEVAEGGRAAQETPAKAVRPPTTNSNPRSTTHEAPSVSVLIQGSDAVPGDRILLRDVAKLDGDPAVVARLGEIDLGATPLIGVRRALTLWGVKAALRGTEFAAVEPRVLPDATVARKGQTVEASAIVAEAKRAVQAITGKDDARYDVGPAAVKTGCGEVTFETTPGHDENDRMPVTVAVLVDGKEVGRRTIVFFVHLDGVKSGDAVRVTLMRNGAVLTTDAKARSAGHLGETVQIVTAEGSTLTATVTGTGSVEVKL